MRAYSMDLRQKIVSAYESGHGTFDELAETFEVGRRTVARFVGVARAGESLWPKPYGGFGPARLKGDALRLLGERVASRPEATLSELSEYLRGQAGATAHPSTVCRALQRLGLPRKKSMEAAERDEEARAEFRREAEAIARRRLVFTDETGFHLAMTRDFGRAPRGERVRQRVARKRGTNVTLIGALRGWVAALSFDGAVDREAFDAFVTELLVPRLRRSDAVRLDNLRVHHASDVEDAVREAKARVLWLPSYSPDFSPLEDCWSKVKALVRGKEPRTASDLNAAMTDALSAVTAADIDGWFRHCGY